MEVSLCNTSAESVTREPTCVNTTIKETSRAGTSVRSLSCLLCYEDFVCDSPDIIDLNDCQHVFCFVCLHDYFHHTIQAQKGLVVFGFRPSSPTASVETSASFSSSFNDLKTGILCPCFANKDSSACQTLISESIIQQVLFSPTRCENGTSTIEIHGTSWIDRLERGRQDWKDYGRHLLYSTDSSLLPCPRCEEPVPVKSPFMEVEQPAESLRERERDTDFYNQRHCHECHHEFCSIHGDVHAGRTCLEYMASEDFKRIQQSERSIRQMTKPCSHCHAAIQKSSGCDHIVCPSCHRDMCFRCGTHVYLSGKVVRSCSQCRREYIDHRYERQYRLRLCLSLPIMIPTFILHIVITSVVAVVSGCFCCCFFCGTQSLPNGHESNSEYNNKDETQPGRQSPKDPWPLSPLRGIQMTLLMIFFPVFALMRDFGVVTPGFEELMERPSTSGVSANNEFPAAPTFECDEEEADVECNHDPRSSSAPLTKVNSWDLEYGSIKNTIEQ